MATRPSQSQFIRPYWILGEGSTFVINVKNTYLRGTGDSCPAVNAWWDERQSAAAYSYCSVDAEGRVQCQSLALAPLCYHTVIFRGRPDM